MGRGHSLPGDPGKGGWGGWEESAPGPRARGRRRYGLGRPGEEAEPQPSAWGSRKRAPRTLALLTRSPTKVEISREGERVERGRSSLLRAGKGAAGGSSGRVTVYEVRMLGGGRRARPLA